MNKSIATIILGFVIVGLSNSSCKKKDEVSLPVVSIQSVEVLGDQKAVFRGVVTDEGGGSVSSRGFCWGSGPAPTLEGPNLTLGAGIGTFLDTLEAFNSGESYYVRAFASNEAGTIYSNAISFTMDTLLSVSYFGAEIYVHPYNNQPFYVWGPLNNATGAFSQGNGWGNTMTINGYEGIFAAKVCADLVAFGHSDWYLPAIDELAAIYDNQNLWPGSFTNEYFWSSTELSPDSALVLNFQTGAELGNPKNIQRGCRCVRRD